MIDWENLIESNTGESDDWLIDLIRENDRITNSTSEIWKKTWNMEEDIKYGRGHNIRKKTLNMEDDVKYERQH